MDATIALCMIVKNPEEGLESCLVSVKDIVDEIRIVSTHNHYTDEIVGICNRVFGAWYPKMKVLFCDCECKGCDINDKDSCFDLAKARNRSFADVESNWILWLDADDYVSPDNCKMIQALANKYKDTDTEIQPKSVLFTYDYDVNTQLMRERLIKNIMFEEGHESDLWIMPVHECICYGSLGDFASHPEVHITHCREHGHNAERNLFIFEKAIKNKQKCIHDNRFIFYYAETLMISGDHKGAVAQFERLGDDLWEGDRFRYHLNILECSRHVPDEISSLEVESHLKDLIFEYPDCAEGYFELGMYYEKKFQKKALASYKNCLGDVPQCEFSVNKSLYNWRAMEKIYTIYSSMSMWKDAMFWATKCKDSLPDGLNIDADLKHLSGKIAGMVEEKTGVRSEHHVTDLGIVSVNKMKFDSEKKIRVEFMNSGPTDLPSIRMRIQAVFEHMFEHHKDFECTRVDQSTSECNVLVMGLPYDYDILVKYLNTPIIIDYPEDLLGSGTTLNENQQNRLRKCLEKDNVKAVVVSSPKLIEQVPKGKAVYIPEMIVDASHD